MAAVAHGAFVAPGDRLCGSGEGSAGEGVYVGQFGELLASRAGLVERRPDGSVSVIRSYAPPPPMLYVGAAVLARVTRLGASGGAAMAEVLAVEGVPLRAPAPAVLRREALRPGGAAGAEAAAAAVGTGGAAGASALAAAVRPGDLLRALVADLGGGPRGACLLSTARDDLGVVHARAASGERMLPISTEEMAVPGTGVRERRKVARPTPAQQAPAEKQR